jgi:hypothetical protein
VTSDKTHTILLASSNSPLALQQGFRSDIMLLILTRPSLYKQKSSQLSRCLSFKNMLSISSDIMPAMLASARGRMKHNGRVERRTDAEQLVSHMKGGLPLRTKSELPGRRHRASCGLQRCTNTKKTYSAMCERREKTHRLWERWDANGPNKAIASDCSPYPTP